MIRTHRLSSALLATALAWGGAGAYTLQEFTFDNPAQERTFGS